LKLLLFVLCEGNKPLFNEQGARRSNARLWLRPQFFIFTKSWVKGAGYQRARDDLT
jgi:hypothetical protein